jgi:hypothetical protein
VIMIYFPMLVINYFMFMKFMAYNVKKYYGSGSSCDNFNLDTCDINNIILIFLYVTYIHYVCMYVCMYIM